nr:MAG TPA: hypothetical protein [Caudoviricetes sp.]
MIIKHLEKSRCFFNTKNLAFLVLQAEKNKKLHSRSYLVKKWSS